MDLARSTNKHNI